MTYRPVKPQTASSGEEADGAAGPARATEKRLSLKKKFCFTVVAVGLSGIGLIPALEVALRLYHGELLATKILGQPVWSLGQSYVTYDPLLGYAPRPGRYELSDSYVMPIGGGSGYGGDHGICRACRRWWPTPETLVWSCSTWLQRLPKWLSRIRTASKRCSDQARTSPPQGTHGLPHVLRNI